MRRVVVLIGMVGVVAIALVLLAPVLVASDWIRDRIRTEIETATGLALSLDGPVSLALVPSLALEAENVGLAVGDAPEFARVGEIRFGLALAPLLDGRIDVTGLALVDPVVDLSVDAEGRPNWTPVESGKAPRETNDLPAHEDSAPPGANPAEASFAVSIRRLTIEGGRLSYIDDRTGTEEVVEDIALRTAVADVGAPVEIEGGFTARGLSQTLALTVSTPATLLSDRRADLVGRLRSAGGTLAVVGSLDAAGGSFAGSVEIASEDVAPWFTTFADGDAPVRSVALSGTVAADARRIEATDLRFAVDGTEGSGEAAIALTGSRPRVDARLRIPRLDLDRLPGGHASDQSDGPAESGGNAADEGASAGERAIDLSALNRFDGGVEVRAAEIVGSALEGLGPVTDATLVAVVTDGRLEILAGPLTVAGGTAEARLSAKPDPSGLRIDGRLKAGGFDLQALAALAGQASPATGTASADVAFAAAGATRAALRESLDAAGSVSIARGTVTGLGLADAFGDPAADRLTDVAVKASFKSLDAPVRVAGDAAFRGEPLALDVTIEPRRMLAGGSFPVTARVSSRRLSVAFDGQVDPGAGAAAGGVGIDAPSLSSALAVLGRGDQDLPPGKVAIFGTLEAGREAIRFTKADFTLGETHLAGDVAVDLAGRPKITARLSGEAVDLGTLIGGASGAGAPPDRGPSGSGPGEPAAAGRGRGWSDEPIDLAGLRGFDADLAIGANRVVFAGTEAGPARLAVTNEAGLLTVDLPDFAIHGGMGAGRVTLDGRAAVPDLAASFRLRDVSALPLLAGAAGFTRLEGRAAMDIDLRTAGRSEVELVQGLAGTASVSFRDGAIRGVDMVGLLQSAALAVVTGFGQDREARTTFHSLTATFRIENGLVSNDDLALDGPLMRATGAGRIDLPRRQIGYRLVPRLVAPDGAEEVSFEVPVIVEGDWSAPRIYPDIQGILEDPEAAYDKLRRLGGAFGRIGRDGGDLGAILEGLAPAIGGAIGGGGQDQGTGDPLVDVLQGVLGGRQQPSDLPPPAPLDTDPGPLGEDGAVPPPPDGQPGDAAALPAPGDPGAGVDPFAPVGPTPLPRPRPGLPEMDPMAPVGEQLPPPAGDAPPVEEPPMAETAEPLPQDLPGEPVEPGDPDFAPPDARVDGEPPPADPMQQLLEQGLEQLLQGN